MIIYQSEKGDVGEALAAFQLSLAFNGETQKESLKGEGRAALDWQLKYPITLYGQKSWRQLGVQVKAGNSYGKWNKSKSNWRLALNKEHMANWHKSNQPVIVIWIRIAEKTEVYCKLIIPTKPERLYYVTKFDKISPCTRFEVERLVVMNSLPKHKIPKFELIPYSNSKEAVKKVKSEFKKTLGVHETPFGKITISHHALRNLTREGRKRSHVKDSLLLLPKAKQVIQYIPKSILTFSEVEKRSNKSTIIKRKVLFVYRNLKFSDSNVTNLYLRFEEVIKFHSDWPHHFIAEPHVEHSLKLESIYRKEK